MGEPCRLGINKSLDLAVLSSKGAKPIIHSDRGAHYRWPGCKTHKEECLTRSMSKKGCSPDNAACEGFGRLKNECFYGEDFNGYSIQAFIRYIDEYIDWYNDTRIKVSLNQNESTRISPVKRLLRVKLSNFCPHPLRPKLGLTKKVPFSFLMSGVAAGAVTRQLRMSGVAADTGTRRLGFGAVSQRFRLRKCDYCPRPFEQ